MATISDELASNIQKCFNKTYTDLANQDSFFFGPSGDVTLTKPDGTTTKIKSWSYLLSTLNVMGSTATINTWEKDQTFSGSVTLSGDNSMFLMGKDSDIGIVKKSGFGSKIVMAKGKNITFATSPNAKVGFSDTVTDVVKIFDNGDITANKFYGQALELSFSTPYIDFHFNNSTADFTHRIIADSADSLTVSSNLNVNSHIWANGQIACAQAMRSYGGFHGQPGVDPSGGNGSILQGPWHTSAFIGRGADSNTPYGQAAWWLEEKVGTEFKMVHMLRGFGSQVQYWAFLNNGSIIGNNGAVAWQGTSDARYKKLIKPTDGQQSLDNIMKMGLVTFVYNDDEQERVRRGVIAQQVQEIDPQYVKEVVMSVGAGPETPAENVKTMSRLTLDNNVLLMDAISAIQVLARRVEELEKRNL